MNMQTELTLSFGIPVYAYKVLQVVEKQDNKIGFRLDKKTGELNLFCSLYDFPDYADDWDKIEDFEDYLKEVE